LHDVYNTSILWPQTHKKERGIDNSSVLLGGEAWIMDFGHLQSYLISNSRIGIGDINTNNITIEIHLMHIAQAAVGNYDS
jgi:hypothetical protein